MTSELPAIRQRIQELYCSYQEEAVEKALTYYHKDGFFTDIDYTVNVRSDWPAEVHMQRLMTLSCAAGERPELQEVILKGLGYWIAHDFRNTNWYHIDLCVPWYLGIIGLNCGEILPVEYMAYILKRLCTDLSQAVKSDKIWTGMNLMFFGRNTAIHGILAEDAAIIQKGCDYMAQTIFLSGDGEEGIYPDGAFAQHEVQLYNFSYGKEFLISAVNWIYVFHDTPFAFGEEKVKLITDLYLNGMAKMSRFDAMDMSPMGRARAVSFRPEGGIMTPFLPAIRMLIDANSEAKTKERLQKAADFIQGRRSNPYEEYNAAYWTVKFMTHQRNHFYASVRMADKQVLGGDLCRGKLVTLQDFLGGFGAYGLSTYLCDGGEYDKIFPVWDWGLLPGTTTPHLELTLEEGALHESEFVGNVSDGFYGFAAGDMKKTYTHTGIPLPDADGIVWPVPADVIPEKPSTASFGGKKAYFFLDEGVFHLGAALYTDAEEAFQTTLEQNLLRSKVVADGKAVEATGAWQDLDCSYVWHDNKVYVNVDGTPLRLKAGEVVGNWNRVYISPTGPQEEVRKNTFTLIKPQGKNHSAYAYAVLPGVGKEEAEAAAEQLTAVILQNDGTIQAIAYKEKIMAVFYEPATLQTGNHRITAEQPCLVLLDDAKKCLYASTPDKDKEALAVTVDGKSLTLSMPQERIQRGRGIRAEL